jgi:hypothetical protein
VKQLLHIENNEYLEITVRHRVGGINHFSGKEEKRGVEVSFTHVIKDGCIHRSKPMDKRNFRILVFKYKRKSQKKIEAVSAYMTSNIEKIFELWKSGDYQSLYDFILEFKA